MEGSSFFGQMWDGLSNLIHGAVGNNRDNAPADVMNVKQALQDTGVMKPEAEPNGYITRPLMSKNLSRLPSTDGRGYTRRAGGRSAWHRFHWLLEF